MNGLLSRDDVEVVRVILLGIILVGFDNLFVWIVFGICDFIVVVVVIVKVNCVVCILKILFKKVVRL